MIAESSPAARRREPVHLKHAVFGSGVSLNKPCIVDGARLDMRNAQAVAIHLDRLSDEGLDGSRGFGQRAINGPIERCGRRNKDNRDQNIDNGEEAAH